MSLDSFQPQGPTSLIAATTTASVAIQPSTGGIIGARLRNPSTGDVWVAASVSSAVVAVLPTTTTPGNGMPLAQGVEAFTLFPNFWISAITTGGTIQLAITPGFGQ